jgi:hypothetical protein
LSKTRSWRAFPGLCNKILQIEDGWLATQCPDDDCDVLFGITRSLNGRGDAVARQRFQRQNASVVKPDALVQTARHVAHRWKAVAARGRMRCPAPRFKAAKKEKTEKTKPQGEEHWPTAKQQM